MKRSGADVRGVKQAQLKEINKMIEAKMFSDRPVKFKVCFDAEPWFGQAGDSELAYLMKGDWGREYPAGDVAAFVATNHDDRLARIFSAMNKFPICIEFGCTIREADAMGWLRRNRPYLIEDEENDDEWRLPLRRYRSPW
jgi:hypothetical protein